MLVRGDHAYLTSGWSPAAWKIGWSEELFDADYGSPVDETCRETAPNSSVFVREYSKASIKMDCTTWTPSLTFKSDDETDETTTKAHATMLCARLQGGYHSHFAQP